MNQGHWGKNDVTIHAGWTAQLMDLSAALYDVAVIEDLIHVLVHETSQETDVNAVNRVSFALVGEVAELAQELHQKAWKPEPPMDDARRKRIIKEWTDVLAFFGSLTNVVMNKTGATTDELARAFERTCKENLRRMQGRVMGYGTYYGRLCYLKEGTPYTVTMTYEDGRPPREWLGVTYRGYSPETEQFLFYKGDTLVCAIGADKGYWTAHAED